MTALDEVAKQPGMESRIALLNAAEREWRERTGNMPPWSVSHVTHHHDCGCLTLAATQLITAQRALINTLADALAEARTTIRDWGIANGQLKDRLAEAQADLVTAEAGEHRLAHAAQLLGWQMECERAMREVAEATIETLRGGPDIAVFVGNECVSAK